jgi:rhodanese-related sulfurtransferase
MKLGKLAAGVVTIVGLSVILGGAVHFSLVRRYMNGEFRTNFVDTRKYAGIVFITLAQAQDLLSQGKAVFIDSRTAAEYAAGHVLGARSVPLESSARGLTELEALYPPDQTLVVYCQGGDCETSTALARLLHDKGFRDIRIFTGGFTEWSAAGLPTEASR